MFQSLERCSSQRKKSFPLSRRHARMPGWISSRHPRVLVTISRSAYRIGSETFLHHLVVAMTSLASIFERKPEGLKFPGLLKPLSQRRPRCALLLTANFGKALARLLDSFLSNHLIEPSFVIHESASPRSHHALMNEAGLI